MGLQHPVCCLNILQQEKIILRDKLAAINDVVTQAAQTMFLKKKKIIMKVHIQSTFAKKQMGRGVPDITNNGRNVLDSIRWKIYHTDCLKFLPINIH